jgi:AraC family transcriptional regulator
MEIKKDGEVKELDSKNVAYVSFTGNYIGNSEVFAELFGKLCGWAGPKGLLNEKPEFISSYQDDPKITPPEELKLEVCMVVPEETEVEGDIKKQTLPGGRYAVMELELTGPEEYGPAWMKVFEWMKENNVELDMSRPSYEIYLNEPNTHPKKHHLLKVCVSVK